MQYKNEQNKKDTGKDKTYIHFIYLYNFNCEVNVMLTFQIC